MQASGFESICSIHTSQCPCNISFSGSIYKPNRVSFWILVPDLKIIVFKYLSKHYLQKICWCKKVTSNQYHCILPHYPQIHTDQCFCCNLDYCRSYNPNKVFLWSWVSYLKIIGIKYLFKNSIENMLIQKELTNNQSIKWTKTGNRTIWIRRTHDNK